MGLATYSNSKSTVLSYVTTFEILWNQNELYEQLNASYSFQRKGNIEERELLDAIIRFYFLSIPPMALRICSTIPFRFSFFATALKHSGHNACKLTGRLSFKDPLICSN
jgi:hypothetical protein